MFKINEVKDFETWGNILITLHGKITDRSLRYWDVDLQPQILIENSIISTIRIQDQALWVYSKDYCSQWNRMTAHFEREFELFYPFFSTGKILLGNRKEGSERFLCAKASDTMEDIWQVNFYSAIYHISENSVYVVRFTSELEKNTLACISLYTGDIRWSYTLPENYGLTNNVGEKKKAEFLKIVGTHDGILWMALYSGRLLGLEVATGKERFYIDRPNSFSSSPVEAEIEHLGVFGFNVQFDKDQEQIFSSTTRFYGELNLRNPSRDFALYDIGDSCREHGLLLNKVAAWEGEDVYFYEGSDNNRFGIFSRSKKEIVWSAEIPEAKDFFPAIRKMDYAGSRIYVLDHFNTLHIFEKPKQAGPF